MNAEHHAENAQTYCSVTSSAPVTMVGYTLGSLIKNLANIEPFTFIQLVTLQWCIFHQSLTISTAEYLATPFKGYILAILCPQIFSIILQHISKDLT